MLYKALHGLATNSTTKNGMASHLLLAQQIFSEQWDLQAGQFWCWHWHGHWCSHWRPMHRSEWDIHPKYQCHFKCEISSKWHPPPRTCCIQKPILFTAQGSPLSALWEWLKLLVVGSAFEMMRRLVFNMYRNLGRSMKVLSSLSWPYLRRMILATVCAFLYWSIRSLADQHGASTHATFKSQPNHSALTPSLWQSNVKTPPILTIRSLVAPKHQSLAQKEVRPLWVQPGSHDVVVWTIS